MWELLILSIVIALGADLYIRKTYSVMAKMKMKTKLNGQEVAEKMLRAHQLKIYVVETKGKLSDHYDSKRKVIRLSPDVFRDNSVASIAVAAHEAAHAIQDKENYLPLRLRQLMAPLVGFASKMSYVVILIGLFTSMVDLLYIGIGLLFIVLIFQLITLPVEFNASSRAISELNKLGIVENSESPKIRKMLQAAAFTYVASVITAVLEIARLMLIARD